MDIGTNEPTGFEFPGYVRESTKPSIVTLLKNGSSIIFYTTLMVVIIALMYWPGPSTFVKIVSSILFVAGIILLYGFNKIYEATAKLDRESEEIYCSMLVCYLFKRMSMVIKNPESVFELVSAFEREHPGIKTVIGNDASTFVSVFCEQLRVDLKNILVSERKEDKLKLLENFSSMSIPDPSLSISSNAFLVQSLVRDVFMEFASEKYDASWIGFYRANKNDIQIKRLLYKIFDVGTNKIKRLEALENA
jgi:hypothetical protein